MGVGLATVTLATAKKVVKIEVKETISTMLNAM